MPLTRDRRNINIFQVGNYLLDITYDTSTGVPLILSDAPETLPAWRLGEAPPQYPNPTYRTGVLAAKVFVGRGSPINLRLYLWHVNAAAVAHQYISVTIENNYSNDTDPNIIVSGTAWGSTVTTGYRNYGVALARNYLAGAGGTTIAPIEATPTGANKFRLIRQWDINQANELIGAILDLTIAGANNAPVNATLRIVAHTDTNFRVATPVLEQYDAQGNPLHSRGYYPQGTVRVTHRAFDVTASGFYMVGIYDKWYDPAFPQMKRPGDMPREYPFDQLYDDIMTYDGQWIGRHNRGNFGAVYQFHVSATNPSDRQRRMRVMFMARATNDPNAVPPRRNPYAAAVKSGAFPPPSDAPRVQELYDIEYPHIVTTSYDTAYIPSQWAPTLVNEWTVPASGSVEGDISFMHAGAATLPVCIVYERIQE